MVNYQQSQEQCQLSSGGWVELNINGRGTCMGIKYKLAYTVCVCTDLISSGLVVVQQEVRVRC